MSNKEIDLPALPIFSSFENAELKLLLGDEPMYETNHAKGSLIRVEGQLCLTWDVITEGEVSIQRIDENGNSMIVAVFEEGDSLGGNLLFSKNPYYPMAVVAKTQTRILHISRSSVLALCQNNVSFLELFLACVSDRTVFLTQKIKSIAMRTIRSILKQYLLDEYRLQKNERVKLRFTKKELAEQMGISRTSLSRELQKMKKDGLIEYDRNFITLKKRLLELERGFI